MKRFITVSLAILLGLVSSTKVISDSAVFLQSAAPAPSTGGNSNSLTVQAQQWVTDATEDLSRINCLLYDDLTFFDLRSLENGNTYQVGTYNFNFCKRLTDANNNKIFAYNGLSTGSVRLTDGNSPSEVDAVLDADTNKRHIAFEIDGGDVCATDATRNYSVKYEITCDSTQTGVPTLTAANLDVTTDTCSPKLTFAHKVGCPVFEATSIVRFLANNPWALGLILIAFGVVVTFFGGKFFPYVLATITGGVVFLVVLLLASLVGLLVALDKGKQSSAGEVTLTVLSFLVAAGLAVLAGWFIKAIRRIGLMLLGATAGFFLGFLLYTFVFAQWAQTVILLTILCLAGAVAGGYLVWKHDKVLIVYLTAFIGGYALVRGVSMFAGNFPNEIFLYQQLTNGAFDGLGWQFYVYVISMVVTGVLGVVYQQHKGYHEHHHDDFYKEA